MGVWSTQLAENEIRKLEQEVLDSIVDRFGPNMQTVRIDEYTVRFPYRRYGHAPLLRVALPEGVQVHSQEIVYTLHRVPSSGMPPLISESSRHQRTTRCRSRNCCRRRPGTRRLSRFHPLSRDGPRGYCQSNPLQTDRPVPVSFQARCCSPESG